MKSEFYAFFRSEKRYVLYSCSFRIKRLRIDSCIVVQRSFRKMTRTSSCSSVRIVKLTWSWTSWTWTWRGLATATDSIYSKKSVNLFSAINQALHIAWDADSRYYFLSPLSNLGNLSFYLLCVYCSILCFFLL